MTEELAQLRQDLQHLMNRQAILMMLVGTVEAVSTGDASMLHHPFFQQQGYIRGTRDESDVSVQRPVTIEGPEPAPW